MPDKNDTRHSHNSNQPIQDLELMQRDSNRIWIGDVTDELAQSFTERVLEINDRDPQAPIILYINSDGGSVFALSAMQAIMDSVSNSFITIGLGRAMSAGADLLAHGDLRFVSPHCRVMIHESSGGAVGHIDDIKTGIEEFVALNNASMEVLARDMGKNPAELQALFKARGRDIFLPPLEAVKLGLADHVGVPAVREIPTSKVSYEISLPKIEKPSVNRKAKKAVATKQKTKPRTKVKKQK